MEMKFCQSCGMPLHQPDDFGTNVDETRNEDFCRYCYQNGNFTQDVTMDEMIEHCAQFVEDFNKESPQQLTREEAVSQMREYFPQLKRWKNVADKE